MKKIIISLFMFILLCESCSASTLQTGSRIDSIRSRRNTQPQVSTTRYNDLLSDDTTRTNSQNQQNQQNQQGQQGTQAQAQQYIQTPYGLVILSGEKKPELTDKQINEYFDQIIYSSADKNPMRELIEKMPRYGMSFFENFTTDYTPMETAPIAQGYKINVGDEATITIWGIPEEGVYPVVVDRNGMATIPHVGSVRIAGYSIPEAERVIQARLNQYYTGYQMNLSMGKLSSITVYVTGNAEKPGAYVVSSFATLVNALLESGGPARNGSLRKIELIRNSRTIAVFDMYAMLLRGDKTQDVMLQAGDVIYIPPVGPLVGLAGDVYKPAVYELNGATRVKDLLYIAGGMDAQTFRGRIQFFRIYDYAYASSFEGGLQQVENMELEDGDILRLFPVYNFAASVTINGELASPGNYVIVPDRTRLSDIVQRAGGLTVTASDIAEITRVTPSMEGPVNERFQINLALAMMGDPEHDVILQNGDHITVLVIPAWNTQNSVTIEGEVMRPGTYAMFPGEKLSDLITKAGGFTPKAFLKGAIFTRKSVAEEQKKSLKQMADRMERELLESMQNTASGSTGTAGAIGALDAEFERRKQLINNLRQIDVMGRVVTKIDTPKNLIGTAWDCELEDGDALHVPKTPLTVNVLGAVYSSSTQIYRKNMSINGYINSAGGALKTAHKRLVYLLKNDGTTIRLTRSTALLSSKKWTAPHGLSAAIEPGDTIVVPVKYLDRQPMEAFKDAVDIVYKVAIAAGVIIDFIND